jgi:hypothetical protein
VKPTPALPVVPPTAEELRRILELRDAYETLRQECSSMVLEPAVARFMVKVAARDTAGRKYEAALREADPNEIIKLAIGALDT